MVSGKFLYQIHTRLNEIFSPEQDIPFGGKLVLVCRDLYQLHPVQAKPVFMFNETVTSEGFLMVDLWHKFKQAELTETMRQKGNKLFIELVHKIRVGAADVSVDGILKSQFVQQSEVQYSYHAMHLFAEDGTVNRYNDFMLSAFPDRLILSKLKITFLKTAMSQIFYEHKIKNSAKKGD